MTIWNVEQYWAQNAFESSMNDPHTVLQHSASEMQLVDSSTSCKPDILLLSKPKDPLDPHMTKSVR